MALFYAPARLYEAEACYEDFLEHAEHNLEMASLARDNVCQCRLFLNWPANVKTVPF